VEPRKPSDRRSILDDNLEAAPQDLDEYERLLAEQFVDDPDVPAAPAGASLQGERDARLRELHQRLFGRRDAADAKDTEP